MKRLSILRHAKSDWGDPSLDDFDRPLNDRGRKAARRMGRELRERGISFDLIIASPAARVRETLDGLTEKLELNAELRHDERMYGASEARLLEIVRGIPESAHAPLLVGHNPGLEQLVAALTNGAAHKFPTAAFAQIDLPADRWADVEPGTGKIAALILPKELD
jgi:phosphohistidine phosphatase